MAANPHSILQAAQDLTGWSDVELATIVGLSRSTVQSYRTGRRTEYLDGFQLNALRQNLNLYRDQIIEAVARLELML